MHDILINVFWPMVSLEEPEAAQRALRDLQRVQRRGPHRFPTSVDFRADAEAVPRGPGPAGAAANLPRLLPDRLLAMPGLYFSRIGQDVEGLSVFLERWSGSCPR